MIHFLNPGADGEFISELKDAGLLGPDSIERIDSALGRPEACALDDFLLAGAETISEPHWLAWLIRRHGCHRFGPARWTEGVNTRVPTDWAGISNLPYRRCADGGLLIATLRPDLRAGLTARLGDARLLWNAATLRECGALRRAWREVTPRGT